MRHFLFHLGVGFDAAIIRRMEARSYLKRHFAHPAFALATVDTGSATTTVARPSASPSTATAAPAPRSWPRARTRSISNSDPYTYVGRRPMRIAPRAALDDALAVTVLRRPAGVRSRAAAASSVGTVDLPRRRRPRSCSVADVVGVELGADAPFPWQVDGDYLGDVDQLDVAYRPDCLTVVVP